MADNDENLRRAGRAELDRLNAGSKKAKPPAAKKRKRYHQDSLLDDYKGLVGIGRAKERRVGSGGESMSEAIDRAVRDAKPDRD